MLLRHGRPAIRLSAAMLVLGLVAGCGENASDAKTQNAAKTTAAAGGAAQSRDWTTVVAATPEGGVRMGNPNARVRLVEYASFTCSHCRDFHLAAAEQLKGRFVRSGAVSYEYRPFMLNGIDYAAALLARCNGPATFFGFADSFYRQHDAWVAPFTRMTQADSARLQALPANQQIRGLAEFGGLDAFVRTRGIPRARFDQCLSDQKAIDALTANAQKGQDQFQITGTPTFILNGEKLDGVTTWPDLQTRLRAAGA